MTLNKNLFTLIIGAIFSVGFLGFLSHDISLIPVKQAIDWCASTFSTYETSVSILFLTISIGGISMWMLRFGLTLLNISKLTPVKSPSNRIQNLLSKLALSDKVIIFDSPSRSAFCTGLVRQKLYISTSLIKAVSENELEAILLHEKYHLMNKHFLERQLAQFIASVYPLIPILRDLARTLSLRQEQRADQYALSQTKPAYLLSAFKKVIHHPSLDIVPGFSSLLEDRIHNLDALASFKVKRSSILISFFSITMIAFVALSHPFSIHARDTHLSHVMNGHMSVQTYTELTCDQILMSRQ